MNKVLNLSFLFFTLLVYTQLSFALQDSKNFPLSKIQNSYPLFYSEDVSATEYPDYYSIDDINSDDNSQNSNMLHSPAQIGQDFLKSSFQLVKELQEESLSLIRWMHHDSPLNDPSEPYNRSIHYGSWRNEPNDGECYNTRALVLIRDSLTPVEFKSTNKCVVESGTWRDPYTNQIFNSAHDIQIDHVVPLKNSYVSGAWKWSHKRRCTYANFMANPTHLLSVNGRENMSKSDRTPEKYMPPNPDFQCSYIKIWLAIKLEWGLVMTPPEARAIKNIIEEQRCDLNSLQLTAAELQEQREFQNNSDICPN